jgi:hypothetical protein
MKSVVVLFLSINLFDITGSTRTLNELFRDVDEYLAVESGKTKAQQYDEAGLIVRRKNLLRFSLSLHEPPVTKKGPSVSRKYSKSPTQRMSRVEKSFAILPGNVVSSVRVKRSDEQEMQKRNGRKKQNNLRKMARDLLSKYARLDVFGYLADKLTGGQGMAIPAY